MEFKLDSKILSEYTLDNVTYIGTASGAIHLLDFTTDKPVFKDPILLHTGPVPTLCFTSEKVLVSGGWDRKIIFHFAEPKVIDIFSDAVKCVYSAFGAIFVGTGDGYTYRFSESGELLEEVEHNTRFVETMAAVGSYLLTAGSDRRIRVLNGTSLEVVEEFNFVNSIREIKYKYGYLFMVCAEKLFREFELPDSITGATLGIKELTVVREIKLPDWGNQIDMLEDFKLSGIFCGCSSKNLLRIIGDGFEQVASGVTDSVLTVECLKEKIVRGEKSRICSMVIYGANDRFIRRIFMSQDDREYFLDTQVKPKEIDLESSDFDDEEVKKLQEERLNQMLNAKSGKK